VLEVIADIICDDAGDAKYRRGWDISRFFHDVDRRFPAHDGSTRKWWVVARLEECNSNVDNPELPGPEALEAIILKLADPREYSGDWGKTRLVCAKLNSILSLDGLKVGFKGTHPQLTVMEEPMANVLDETRPTTPDESSILGREIFIVHGHDGEAKEAVARLIMQLGHIPVILSEQPSLGKTLIEKLEYYSSRVGFVVVLLTPDDIGGPANVDPPLNPRARQNVVLELGFFLAKLKRSNVCALYKEGVEIPSDYDGVLYVVMDNARAWRFQLATELRAAGFEADANRIN
jgi:predicted nucleotide-binding protein